MKMFKLQGTGLDLRNPTKKMITPLKEDRQTDFGVKYIEYVLIDLLEGKEWYTGDLIEDSIVNGASILAYVDMSKLPNTPEKDQFIFLKELLYDWKWSSIISSVDIKLLALENIPEGKIINIKDWLNDVVELGLVIQTPLEGVEKLEKWKMVFGEYPKNVFRPISPLLYSPELEDKLANEKISTWGLDWNGGDLTKELEYQVFTKSYLLSFAAFHSNVILIPTHIGAGVDEISELEFLQSLKFKEMREKEDAKFILKKPVSRLVKTPKKIVYESTDSILNWKLPINNSSLLIKYSDIVYSFNSPLKKFEKSKILENYKIEELEKYMLSHVSVIKEEVKGSEELYWRYLTMLGYDVLKNQFIKDDESDLWEMEVYEAAEHVLMFSLTKYKKKNWFTRNFPKEAIQYEFFLLAMDSPDNIYFLDLKKIEIEENTDSKNSIP